MCNHHGRVNVGGIGGHGAGVGCFGSILTMLKSIAAPVVPGAMIVLWILTGCVTTDSKQTAQTILAGLQTATATVGAACQAGVIPPEYCATVSLAWFAEQTLAKALDLDQQASTPETRAAVQAAQDVAVRAKAQMEAAKL